MGGRRNGTLVGSGLRFPAKAVALGPQRGLGAVGDVELAEDPRQVRLHRLVADLQLAGDELVGQALDEQREHFALALGQPGERIGLGAGREDRPRRARVERRLAAGGGADAVGDVVGGGVLEQVAAGAGVERGEDPRAVGERGEHEHGGLGTLLEHAPGRLDAVDARHVEVHDDHVGLQLAGALDRLRPVGGGADELDVVDRRDEPAEALADHAVVVGEQHPDHAGTSISTVVPSPGCERTLSVPPVWRTSSSSSDRPTWPSSARRSRSAASKPRPSSRTTSRVAPGDGCVTSMRTESAFACARTLRSASRATRYTSASRGPPLAALSSTCSSVAMPAAASGLSRSLSATSRPEVSRRGGWISTSSVRRSRWPWRRWSMALRRMAASLSSPRRAAPSASGLSPNATPARSCTGPSCRSDAIRRRSWLEASIALASSRSRSRWPRCSRRAIDHASGIWKTSRTIRPPISGGARARRSRSARAVTEPKRWQIS